MADDPLPPPAGYNPVPALDAPPGYQAIDPNSWTEFFRNNKFTRLSNLIEHGATLGLNTEVKPAADWLVAQGRRALGYDNPTVTGLVTGKQPQTPGEVYQSAKQHELDKYNYAHNEFGPVPEIAAGLGGIGPSNIIRNAAGELVPAIKTAAGDLVPASTVVKDTATGKNLVRDATGKLVPVAESQGFLGNLSGVAKAGAGMGAVSGLAAGNGPLDQRLADMAEGAGVGAGTGVAFHSLVSPIVKGVGMAQRYARSATRNALNPQQAAIEAVADKGVEDNIDFQALRKAFSPQPSSALAGRGFTEDDLADIVSRKLKGEASDSIAKDYNLHKDTVSKYFNDYQAANPTPLNVLEMARIEGGPGSGQNTADFARANANLYPQPEMMQRLAARAVQQPERIRGIVESAAPGSKLEETQAALTEAMEQDADRNFRALHKQPDVLVTKDLGQLLTHPLSRGQWEQARNIASSDPKMPFEIPSYDEMAKSFGIRPRGGMGLNEQGVPQAPAQYPTPPGALKSQLIPVKALDYFDRALRSNAETAFNQPNGGTLGTALNNMRQRLANIIDPLNPGAGRPVLAPGWRQAKDSYARYQSLIGNTPGKEGALPLGAKTGSAMGQARREAVSAFQQMDPAQQKLFRMGQARHLQDMLGSVRGGNDAAGQYSTVAVKQMINEVFPPKIAEKLNSQLGAENVTVKSLRDLFGNSTTAKQILGQNRLLEAAGTAADAALGRWGEIRKRLAYKLTDQIGKQGAAEILRTLSETDPANVLKILGQLSKAAQSSAERQAYMQALSQSRGVLPLLAGKYAAEQATQPKKGFPLALPAPASRALR